VRRFELLEPATLEEAIGLLDPEDPGVRALAGATALIPMMKSGVFQPTRLVSLRRLEGELRGVHAENGGGLRIGALTTLSELEHSPGVRASAPVITRALRTLSNVRIRNVATLGGHLGHGDPHMDLPPILMTLNARVRAVGPKGQRWIDMNDLAVGYYQTALEHGELIADVHVPVQPPGVCTAYAKFTALSADDWPTVGVAAWFRIDGSQIAEARVAISAATERPTRVSATEAILTGALPAPETFATAAEAAAEDVETLADIRGSAAYKREMIRVYVRRALAQALAGRDTGNSDGYSRS
jgi:aerobic carbon-monoxide dehydrogenase medium subunit